VILANVRGFSGHGTMSAMSSDGLPGGAGQDTGTDWVFGGRYRLISQVGVGGMAVVWQAYDNVLARTVAVKVLATHAADAPQSRHRIRREAQAAAALSHPNIAQVYDYGEADIDGHITPYVVMELIRGDSLQQRLMDGPMLARNAMRVCAEIAAALAAAHTEGLVHRDIKPANIMLASTGAKVVDFGIAAGIRPPGSGADDVEVLGTPAYVAPERLLHDAVQPASDVYALGVLLYRLLAGHSPWSSETTTQMLTAHIYVEPAPLLPMYQVPDYVTALCNRCLDKDPTQRPSAREAAALLAHGAGLQVVTDESPVREEVAIDPIPSVLIRAPGRDGVSPSGAAAHAVRQPSPPPGDLDQPSRADDASPAVVATAAPSAAAGASGTLAENGRAGTQRSPKRKVYALVAAAVVAAVAVTVWLLPTGGQNAAESAQGVNPSPSSAGQAAVQQLPGASTNPTTTVRPTGVINTAPTGPAARTPATAAPGGGGPTATAPVTAGPEPAVTTTPPPPEPVERTLTSDAGSVRATCPAADTAQILSWAATKPYKVVEGDSEAGPAPAVSFKHGNRNLTMTVTCSRGVPSATSS
jgi:serine/threonine-protein kinase